MMIEIDVPNTKFKIEIDATNIERYRKLIDDINNPYESNCDTLLELSEEFKYYLKSSYDIEKSSKELTPEIINNIDMYLSDTSKIPKVETLYHLMFNSDEQCLRDEFVGVYRKQTRRYIEYYNVGMNPKDLDLNELQNLVNWLYSEESETENSPRSIIGDDILAFICYLLYERIHPHIDGNGRIGRLLFIENSYNHLNYPISVILRNLRDDIFTGIFEMTNFKYKHFNNTEPKYPDTNLYYQISVNDELLRKIVKCLCIAKEYKVLFKSFRNCPIRNIIISRLLRRKLNEDEILMILSKCLKKLSLKKLIPIDDLFCLFQSSQMNLHNHNLILSLC